MTGHEGELGDDLGSYSLSTSQLHNNTNYLRKHPLFNTNIAGDPEKINSLFFIGNDNDV